jgi:hypothetical protein
LYSLLQEGDPVEFEDLENRPDHYFTDDQREPELDKFFTSKEHFTNYCRERCTRNDGYWTVEEVDSLLVQENKIIERDVVYSATTVVVTEIKGRKGVVAKYATQYKSTGIADKYSTTATNYNKMKCKCESDLMDSCTSGLTNSATFYSGWIKTGGPSTEVTYQWTSILKNVFLRKDLIP